MDALAVGIIGGLIAVVGAGGSYLLRRIENRLNSLETRFNDAIHVFTDRVARLEERTSIYPWDINRKR